MTQDDLKDYYGLLGVSTSSETSEIHKAYWRKASLCHPDKGGTHEKMIQIAEAWRILSDPSKRARYNQMRKYRQEGWHSRKFDEDVQDARRSAENYARSWADFEAVYQKAFYTFNQDFYGDDADIKPAGPFSPLLKSGNAQNGSNGRPKQDMEDDMHMQSGYLKADYFFKAFAIILAVIFAFLWHRNNSGIGRYAPLSNQSQDIMMLDTASGAVYTLEKRTGEPPRWKTVIQPLQTGIIGLSPKTPPKK